MKSRLEHWRSKLLRQGGQPVYRQIASIISAEIDSGDLSPRDRLPTLRDVASALDLDYTTAARGYGEARRLGLIDSRPGMGTFVKGKTLRVPLRGGSSFEMTMNLPTEPDQPPLVQRVKESAEAFIRQSDFFDLFRYQDFGGSLADREAGAAWLERFIADSDVDTILVCPGIHSVLVALLSLLARSGVVCVPDLVYPGLKAIAAQLDVKLQALECDADGPRVSAFDKACKTGEVKALYLNPTLQNPTTQTMPLHRRESLAQVALRYSIPIIEDEAYAALPAEPVTALADMAPELTYYITGFSKCFGAGMRVAYVKSPNRRMSQRLAGALRALNVMASPVTNALMSRWVNDGVADAMLCAIRQETVARQALVAQILKGRTLLTSRDSFHLWLTLPSSESWNPANVATHLRNQGVGAVSSAAFSTDNNPPDAIRICLGGSGDLDACRQSLLQVADILEHPAQMASVVL